MNIKYYKDTSTTLNLLKKQLLTFRKLLTSRLKNDIIQNIKYKGLQNVKRK